MTRPRLMLGVADDLLEADIGLSDNGTPYTVLGKTDRVAPAGTSGECAFVNLYVTTTQYDAGVTITLVPYVNEVALAAITLTLGAVARKTTTTHELSLLQAYVRDAVERSRYAPRGQWFYVQVSVSAPQKVDVDHIEVEYETVVESMEESS